MAALSEASREGAAESSHTTEATSGTGKAPPSTTTQGAHHQPEAGEVGTNRLSSRRSMCPCKPTEGATAHFCSVIKRKVCQPYSGQSPIRDRHKARACQQQCYIRQVTPTSGKLGGNHPRSMGPACSSGVQNRLCAHPSATQSSHNTPVLKGRTGSGETSGDRAHSKGSNTGGSSREKPVCLHPVPRTKEGRSAETGDKLKEVKCLRTHRAFQNGGHTYPPGTAETGRLDGQDRPPGCLLHGSYTRGTQRIPGFLPRRHNVSLQLPPVRPVVCPLGLYQDPITSNGPSPRDGFPPCCLHRRHSGYGRHSSRSEGTGASPVLPPRKPGVHSQPEKCQLTPTQTIEFLGFTLNSLTMELKLPGEKSKKIRLEARKLLKAQQVQARDLSRLIGKMSAAMRAIPPAPLFYRTLQAELAQALAHHDQDCNAPLVLTREAKEELQWWIDHLLQWNGKALISPKPTVTITTDASLTGWGATCQEIRTGGPWSFLEAQEHINWLEPFWG